MKQLFLFAFLLTIGWNGMAQSPSLHIKAITPTQLKQGHSYKLKAIVNHNFKEEKTGGLTCTLLNAATHKSVDGWFINIFPFQYFTTINNTPFETEFSFTVPHEYKGSFEVILVAQVEKVKDSVHYIIPTNK